MSFYLAVDAGGTKTEFVLADELHELARVRTGTIKRMRADERTAAHNLGSGLAEIEGRTGVSMRSIEACCVGAAGSSVPLVSDWLRAEFSRRVSGSLYLVGDVEIALDAAFQGAPGVVAIAGTGSNVAGRDQNGLVTTTGGWGPALSDQASGHRVGLEALRALFLSIDEEQNSALLETILERWGLGSVSELVERANHLPSPDFSELAPVVVACAAGGDLVAAAVLRNQARQIGYLVELMIRRLQRTGGDESWLPELAFAGSMLEHVPLLRQALTDSLRLIFPALQWREHVVDPLLGALWRARAKQTP